MMRLRSWPFLRLHAEAPREPFETASPLPQRVPRVLLVAFLLLLAMERGGARLFYQTDDLGSVRALVNGAGVVVERVNYDPFGAPAFSGGGPASALGNPFLFRGHRYAAGSGFYVFGGRRYEPSTGRYLQRGPTALGNPYAFAGNNPAR
jgi:RHS repeat-associated protein